MPDPVGVKHVAADVTDIDVAARLVACSGPSGPRSFEYDRLVFAAGSQFVRPPIPGLTEHGFDVDTYEAAQRLNDTSPLCRSGLQLTGSTRSS